MLLGACSLKQVRHVPVWCSLLVSKNLQTGHSQTVVLRFCGVGAGSKGYRTAGALQTYGQLRVGEGCDGLVIYVCCLNIRHDHGIGVTFQRTLDALVIGNLGDTFSVQ